MANLLEWHLPRYGASLYDWVQRKPPGSDDAVEAHPNPAANLSPSFELEEVSDLCDEKNVTAKLAGPGLFYCPVPSLAHKSTGAPPRRQP